jgi:hypothetical protein
MTDSLAQSENARTYQPSAVPVGFQRDRHDARQVVDDRRAGETVAADALEQRVAFAFFADAADASAINPDCPLA